MKEEIGKSFQVEYQEQIRLGELFPAVLKKTDGEEFSNEELLDFGTNFIQTCLSVRPDASVNYYRVDEKSLEKIEIEVSLGEDGGDGGAHFYFTGKGIIFEEISNRPIFKDAIDKKVLGPELLLGPYKLEFGKEAVEKELKEAR